MIAFKDFLEAGVICGLRIELVDGRVIQIKSDETWRIVPNGEPGWETKTRAPANWAAAKIVAASSALWWSARPQDFVVVPQLRPVLIPFWQRAVQCLLEVDPDMPALNFDLPLRRSLLLVIKEVLTNAAKHSEATRLLLKIYRSGQKLVVVVEDNGRGFDSKIRRPHCNGEWIAAVASRMCPPVRPTPVWFWRTRKRPTPAVTRCMPRTLSASATGRRSRSRLCPRRPLTSA